MTKPISILKFFELFPDNETCLDHLMNTRYGNPLECPNCGKNSTFSRHSKRPVYQCQWCGHQVSPMSGTPFEASHTPLVKWFYAMYLFTTSRHGVPAKELQRQLSVTYKTAWRMGHEIRKYMAEVDGDTGLGGHVEVDETIVGGRVRGAKNRGRTRVKGRFIVFGMAERGGDVMTRVVPDDRKATFSIEGFWSRLKNSIKGTHIHVSKKHLSKYLGEFEYRYNMRANPSLMFDRLLKAF